MNLEVLCWYTWHASILSFLAMLELGSGSDTVKDMHLQWRFWKQAYPQKHTSACWCCFTAQSACHRCNLQCLIIMGKLMQWEALSHSHFSFVVVFRLFVTPKGLKTNSGTLSNTRRIWILQEKDGFFFLFVWDFSGQLKCCLLSMLPNMIFLHKSNTTHLETPPARCAAVCCTYRRSMMSCFTLEDNSSVTSSRVCLVPVAQRNTLLFGKQGWCFP